MAPQNLSLYVISLKLKDEVLPIKGIGYAGNFDHEHESPDLITGCARIFSNDRRP